MCLGIVHKARDPDLRYDNKVKEGEQQQRRSNAPLLSRYGKCQKDMLLLLLFLSLSRLIWTQSFSVFTFAFFSGGPKTKEASRHGLSSLAILAAGDRDPFKDWREEAAEMGQFRGRCFHSAGQRFNDCGGDDRTSSSSRLSVWVAAAAAAAVKFDTTSSKCGERRENWATYSRKLPKQEEKKRAEQAFGAQVISNGDLKWIY